MTEWNCVTVIPIRKKPGRKGPNNYRGMDVANSSYKIYTQILHDKLKRSLENFLDGTLYKKMIVH
jgi:hypothetical protein